MASVDEKNSLRLLDVDERQNIKDLEDQIVDVLLALDSTNDTILSLLEKYRQFCQDTEGNLEDTKDRSFDLIDCAFRDKQREVHSSRKKVETLYTKLQGTTNLVGNK